MNYLAFEDYFKNKILNGQEKFSVIIGSGIHFEVIKQFNCLTSWRCLLSSISDKPLVSSNNLIAFEEIIQEKTKTQNKKDCNKIENEFLTKISSKISKLQKNHIKTYDYSKILEVFNPKYISDIISLNFDTTIETLFKEKYNLITKRGVFSYQSPIKKYNHTFVYFEYELNDYKIRFWYPHGSIKKPTSLILSNRSYSNYLSVIESVRKNFKKVEREQNYKKSKDNITWISQLINNPVLILGASLSYDEIDLWSLIITRERNYSKIDNHDTHRKPIFQITKNKINNAWIDKLFENNLSYEEQWKKLNNLLE